MRRVSPLILALFGLVALGVAYPASASDGCSFKSKELAFIKEINERRANNNLRPLTKDLSLTRVGRHHTLKMVNNNDLYHSTNENKSPHPNSYHLTNNWNAWAENVGRGNTVNSLMKAFMNSPSHKANILWANADYVGAGTASGHGDLWVTMLFWDGPNPGVNTTNFHAC